MSKDPLALFVISLAILTCLVAFSITMDTPKPYLDMPSFCTQGCPKYGVSHSEKELYMFTCVYDEQGRLSEVLEAGETVCGVERDPSGDTLVIRNYDGSYTIHLLEEVD